MPNSANSRADICRLPSILFILLSRICPERSGSHRARTARCNIGASLDLHSPHPALDLGTDQIDVEKPVVQPRATHLDTLGENERPLELPGGDAPVQIYALRIVHLLAADD